MDDDATQAHQLNTTTRAICSHKTTDPSVETSRFYAGTCSTHEQNKIYIFEFDDYENNLYVEQVKLKNNLPIWQLTHTHDYLSIVTGDYISLYSTAKLSDDLESTSKAPELDFISEFTVDDGATYVAFNETEGNAPKSISVLGSKEISIFDLGKEEKSRSFTLPSPLNRNLERGELLQNPHDPNILLQCSGKTLSSYDYRVKSPINTFTSRYRIRSFDINPNRPDYTTVAGDDRVLTTFDIRNSNGSKHVVESGHTHWIWKVRYNPFHDRLLLSGGSDNRFLLYNQFETSSDNIKKSDWRDDSSESFEAGERESSFAEKAVSEGWDSQASEDYLSVVKVADGIVHNYEDFEDSVYDLAWSHSDPWIYAAVSYDGRMLISHVPKDVKYSILL